MAAEYVKWRYHRGQRANAYFWRNSTGQEVDLLIESGPDLKAVEIKSGETLNSEFFKSLRYFKRLSGQPDENFFLIYGGEQNASRKHVQVMGWPSLVDFNWLSANFLQ